MPGGSRGSTPITPGLRVLLEGAVLWSRRYRAPLTSALEYFRKAIEEDAGYALAFAGLADAYTFLAFYSLVRPRDGFLEAYTAA